MGLLMLCHVSEVYVLFLALPLTRVCDLRKIILLFGVRSGSAVAFPRNRLSSSTMACFTLLRHCVSGSETELELTGGPWMALTLSMESAFMGDTQVYGSSRKRGL